ncbi:MAG: sensor histidine kinase [Rhodocyclaceae bacterium]|nr:sensor histidine kinase [Rhodocyclaceae bacterium]
MPAQPGPGRLKADAAGFEPGQAGRDRRLLTRTLLLYLLPWWLLLPGLAALLHRYQTETELVRLESHELELLDTHAAGLSEAVTRLDNDIRLIANVAESTAARYAAKANRNDALAIYFSDFLRAHSQYTQARLLDPRCHEQVRVDRRSGAVQRIAEEALQDKAGRDYCDRPLASPDSQHYLSRLDANIENGRVVLPLEPTMRASAVVRGEHGAILGVAVLNFDAREMLDGFSSPSTTELALLDEDGYWLRSRDRIDEFAFINSDQERRFSKRYPKVWQAVHAASANRGSLLQSDGLWTYRRIEFAAERGGLDPPVWFAISRLPADRYDAAHRTSEYQLAGVTSLALMVVSLMALALARSHVRSERTAAMLARSNQALNRTIEELNTSRDELVQQEKLSSLGLLVAGVSHEMNTPLGAATLAATALQEQLRGLRAAYERGIKRSDLERFATEQAEGLNLLAANLERANALSRQFKEVAADRANASRQRFALHLLVTDVLALSHNVLKHGLIELTTEVPESLLLESYPGPLGQVIQNLVLNAAHHAFAPRRQGRLTLRAMAGAREGWLRLEIIDDGRGIADDIRERIWDPFFTTRRGEGGTGLGLHICHQLVTVVLGGRIFAEAGEAGRGTRMVVEIPLIAPQDSPATRPT